MTTKQKRAIPEATRRAVALRYGCTPGTTKVGVPCHWCGTSGEIHWTRLASGRPAAWVTFTHELDHVIPEARGGDEHPANIVLACRSCNRHRGHRLTTSSRVPHVFLSEYRQPSSRVPHARKGREGKGTGNGSEGNFQDQAFHLTVGAARSPLVGFGAKP